MVSGQVRLSRSLLSEVIVTQLVPCDAKADIEISFGGVNYRIPAASFVLGPYAPIGPTVYEWPSICHGGFAETNQCEQPFLIV
jgi:hypothetical protein